MTQRHLLCFAVIGLALFAAADAGAQKKIYCWNENGKKVCGDAVPAEAADSARTEISARSGIATGRVARAPSQAERAAAALAADAARRDADAEASRQRRDLAMVESYATEADLRRAYGERTTLLDETVKASQLGVSNLRLSLLGLLRQAGDRELAQQPVPAPLAASIRQQHAELVRQQQILARQRADRARLGTELNEALVRYRSLKASAEASAAAAPPG